jgi:dipeptidyl aminopeptidase/acylaminoacyl peptidase
LRARFVADVTRSRPSVAVIAAALGLVGLAPAAHGAFPGRNGFIAYVHNASGSQGEEGEGPTTSTNALKVGRLFGQERFTLRSCTRVDDVPQEPACATAYDSPAYSPLGDHLLVDAGDRLAILASDGSDFRLLPQQTANDGAPAWAPDGTRFVFTGVAEGASEPDLYVYNLARDRSRRLTSTGGTAPAWSSRGRIVYVTGYSAGGIRRPPTGRLALINPDGSGRRPLTRKNGLAPNWSPHGTKVAFVRKGRLYVIGANGNGLRRVGGRRFSVEAEDVTWSPDGRFLAYHDFESGIMVVDATGRREYEFEPSQYSVGGSFDAYTPDWQPLPPRRRR